MQQQGQQQQYNQKFRYFKKRKGKRRKLNMKRIIRENADEFCRNTTFHAIKYINCTDLSIKEKWFFAIFILLALIMSSVLIMDVLNKWSTTPFIIGVNPYSTLVTDEPFPAVTICNLNQAINTKVQHFQNNSAEKIMLDFLCNGLINFTILETVNSLTQVENFIIEVSQHCDDMLVECSYGATKYNCRDIFQPTITDEGYCCAFNMLHPKFMYIKHIPEILDKYLPKSTLIEAVNWNAETGYSKNVSSNYYPRPTMGSGETLGLTVTLDVQQDKYFCSSSSGVGFKLGLHSPNEVPNIVETGILLEPGKETKLRVVPLKSETETDLHFVPKNLRQCVFYDESHLQAFAHYSLNNCEKECGASVLYKKCGCISHFMPKFLPNITICSIKEKLCEYRSRKFLDASMQKCLDHCLPSCYYLDFNVDAFSTKLFYKNSYEKLNLTKDYVEKNLAVMHIFFQDNSFRSNKQTKFIDFTNFLSSAGGLLSLFLGCSFLSLVELFYYVCIRPWKFYSYNDQHPIIQDQSKLSKVLPRYTNRWRFNSRLYKENIRLFQHKNQERIFHVTSDYYREPFKEYYFME